MFIFEKPFKNKTKKKEERMAIGNYAQRGHIDKCSHWGTIYGVIENRTTTSQRNVLQYSQGSFGFINKFKSI